MSQRSEFKKKIDKIDNKPFKIYCVAQREKNTIPMLSDKLRINLQYMYQTNGQSP